MIVGAGFGGLAAARALRGSGARVTIVDRQNHHLFQPLLYQVATAGRSPADIAAPIRSVVARHERTQVLLDEVTGVDAAARRVRLASGATPRRAVVGDDRCSTTMPTMSMRSPITPA